MKLSCSSRFKRNLSLNKTELIAADTSLSKAGRVLESALENLTRGPWHVGIRAADRVWQFTVASRAERIGRNPSTGEQ